MKNAELMVLIFELKRLVGDKRYFRDIQSLLERLELTPQEKLSLIYLANDLKPKVWEERGRRF
jgi:hypothetical protein